MSPTQPPDGHEIGLVVEQRGAARWLRLNRPARRNALTVALVTGLADAVLAAGDDVTVRAVVLTGAGPAFCAGGDLHDLSRVAEDGALAVTDVIYRQFHRLVAAIGACHLPVLAAVNGAALGAGLDLALACDLRYAAESAVFASSWIGVGLVPGMGGAHLLTHAIGSTRATEMVLLGKRVEADEALSIGLINGVVRPEDLEQHVAAVAESLAELSPAALARSKASLRRAAAGFERELAALGPTQGSLLTSDGFRSAAARFQKSPQTDD